MFYYFIRFLAELWIRMFFGLKIYGAENVPRKGPLIIASNHASYLDPALVAVASPRVLHFMARESLFRNRFFGWAIRNLNAMPVKRGFKDLHAIKQAASALKKSGALLVFPEGTRTTTGHLGEAKPGFAFIANITGALVVPTYIKGTFKAWPRGRKKIIYTPLSVCFGRPMKFDMEDPTKEDYQRFADRVMAEVSKLGDAPLQKNRV